MLCKTILSGLPADPKLQGAMRMELVGRAAANPAWNSGTDPAYSRKLAQDFFSNHKVVANDAWTAFENGSLDLGLPAVRCSCGEVLEPIDRGMKKFRSKCVSCAPPKKKIKRDSGSPARQAVDA